MKDAGGEGRETLEEREARMKDFLASEKIPGKGTSRAKTEIRGSSNRITADYVQPATAANPNAKHYARKRSKVVRTSASVLAVKNRTRGRNRTERRGS